MPESTPGRLFLPGCSRLLHTPLLWIPRTENALPWELLLFCCTKRSHSVLNRENRHSVPTQWWMLLPETVESQSPNVLVRCRGEQPAVVGPQPWPFPCNRSLQCLEHLDVVCSIDSLPVWYSVFQNYTAIVKERDNHSFRLQFGQTCFFHSRSFRCLPPPTLPLHFRIVCKIPTFVASYHTIQNILIF